MLGVTGPNEYENNVNNNWYTNYIACWCLQYAMDALEYVKSANLDKYNAVVKKIDFGGEVSVDRKHLDDSPEPIEADSGTASILLPHLAQPSLRES